MQATTFCPSCHQKRVVEYGEWLLSNVLKNVPHRQWVFSIPKRLEAVLKILLGFKVEAGPSVRPQEYSKCFED